MKDPRAIQEEIAALQPVSLWGCRKEIRDLREKLFDDEKIAGLVRVFSRSTICLLVATDQRLIIMDNFLFYGTDHKDISYMQISGVDYNTRLLFGKIVIEDQTGRNYYDYALNRDLKKFVNILLKRVNAYRDRIVSRPEHGKPSKGMIADELEKLWKLTQEGALTRDEYEQRKQKLLAKSC